MPEFQINLQSVVNQLQAKLSEAMLENVQLVSIIEEVNKSNEAMAAQLRADESSETNSEESSSSEVAGHSTG